MLTEVILEIVIQVHDGTYHAYERVGFLAGLPQRGMFVDGYGLPEDPNAMGADSMVIAVKFVEEDGSPLCRDVRSGLPGHSLRVSLAPHRAPAHTPAEVLGQVLRGPWRYDREMTNVIDVGSQDLTPGGEFPDDVNGG